MLKPKVIQSHREDQFLAKLEELINTNKVHSINYSLYGSIRSALVILEEGKHGRKAAKSRVSTATDSVDKGGRGSKKKDAKVPS